MVVVPDHKTHSAYAVLAELQLIVHNETEAGVVTGLEPELLVSTFRILKMKI